MKRFWCCAGWLILSGFLILMGILIRLTPGFSFSSYVLFGCAGVVLTYRFLRWLRRRNPKLSKVLRTALTIVLCLGLLLATVTGVLIRIAAKGAPDEYCNYVIVLGAGVNGSEPSLILSERIQRAYDYLMLNPDAVCIVSGGQGDGENITEALCMYDHLVAKGIAPDRIWQEDKATSTEENIRFSLELIETKTGARPCRAAVISNEFHLFRAELFAKEQNLDMVGVPAKTTYFSLRANYFLREIVAVWYYMILGG